LPALRRLSGAGDRGIAVRNGRRQKVPDYCGVIDHEADKRIELSPIGWVESPLTDLASAPKQGDEGAPDAWLVLNGFLVTGLIGLRVGEQLVVITWLDRARRDVLEVFPRDDRTRSPQGVFTTRSPDRPNPIGLHQVEVAAIADNRIQVHGLEAIDGTPILDLKPVLSSDVSER